MWFNAPTLLSGNEARSSEGLRITFDLLENKHNKQTTLHPIHSADSEFSWASPAPQNLSKICWWLHHSIWRSKILSYIELIPRLSTWIHRSGQLKATGTGTSPTLHLTLHSYSYSCFFFLAVLFQAFMFTVCGHWPKGITANTCWVSPV